MSANSGYQVKLIKGGVEGVKESFVHMSQVDNLGQSFYKELGPGELSALTGLLSRGNSFLIGQNQPSEPTPDNISRYIANAATGSKRVGGAGVILTQGKGLSVLASTNETVHLAVQEAHKKAAEVFAKVYSREVVSRIGQGGSKGQVTFDPDSFRAVVSVHSHSAAGDSHSHAHILLSTTADVNEAFLKSVTKKKGRSVDTDDLVNCVMHLAGAEAKIAFIQSLEAQTGIRVDPVTNDIFGVSDEQIAKLEAHSKMSNIMKKIKDQEASGYTRISSAEEHDLIWKKARQAVVLPEDEAKKTLDDPITDEIRRIQNTPIVIHTAKDGREVTREIHIPSTEALEQALDVVQNLGSSGFEAVLSWHEERGAGFKALGDELLMTAQASKTMSLKDRLQEAVTELEKSVFDGARVTPEALNAHVVTLSRSLNIQEDLIAQYFEKVFLHLDSEKFIRSIAKVNEELVLIEEIESHLVSSEVFDRALIEEAEELVNNLLPSSPTPTMRAALNQPRGLVMISGVAGAGKTSNIVKTAKSDWLDGNETIWISSRTAKIADDLGNALPDELRDRIQQLPNKKLEVLVANGKGPKPGDRVVIDEIGVADLSTWKAIRTMLSQGVSVVALGDEIQLSPIDSNGIASTLLKKSRMLGHPALDETRRCEAWKDEHDLLRSAVKGEKVDLEEIVENFTSLSFASLEEATSFISENTTTKDVLILAQSNADRSEASSLLRSQARQIHPDQPTCITSDGDFVIVGDRIRFRHIVRVTDASGKRHDLAKTGEEGEIVEIDDSGVQVQFKRGSQITSRWLSHETIAADSVLADASTTAAAQGATCEQGYVLLRGGEDGKFIYSAATRSRQKPIFICVPRAFEGSGVLSQAGIDEELDPRQVLKTVIGRRSDQPDIFEALENIDVAQRDQIRAEIKAKAQFTSQNTLSTLLEAETKPLDMSRYRIMRHRHQALLKRRAARKSKEAEQQAEDLRSTKQKWEAETDQFVRSFFGKPSQIAVTTQVKEDLTTQKADDPHRQIATPVEPVESFVDAEQASEQIEIEVSELTNKKPRRKRGLGR